MNRKDFDDEDEDDHNNHFGKHYHQLLFRDYEVDSILSNSYNDGAIADRSLFTDVTAVKLRVHDVPVPPPITYHIPTTALISDGIPNIIQAITTVTDQITTTFDITSNKNKQVSESAYDKKSSYDRLYNNMKTLHTQLYRVCNYASVELGIDGDDEDDKEDDNSDSSGGRSIINWNTRKAKLMSRKEKKKFQKVEYKEIKDKIFKLKDTLDVMVMIDVSYQFILQLLHSYHEKHKNPRKLLVQKFHEYYHYLSPREKAVMKSDFNQLYNCEEEYFVILTRAGTGCTLCTVCTVI